MKELFLKLSPSQRRIVLIGFSGLVAITLVHNPLSGYNEGNSYEGVRTKGSIGSGRGGFLDLGYRANYLSFVVGMIVLTAASTWVSGLNKD
jgi:hypothetical protein